MKDPRRHKQQTDESATRSEDTGLLTTSLRVVDSAASKLQATRAHASCTTRDAHRPQEPPKEAVRFKSMTLKEAYSVPKHTSAICVQSFDDSLNSAIHITYRISLRSSSLREPRYPLLRVLDRFDFASRKSVIRISHDTQCVLTQSCTNKRVWLLMRLLHHSCSLARKRELAHKKHRHFARVGMDSR